MENIELYRNTTILFFNFLADKLILPKEAIYKSIELVEEAYRKKNIKILKSGHNEISLFCKEMPLQMQLELKELFKEKLDLDLDIFKKLFHKNIEKIIKRGKILNDDEYRLLLDKMDDLTEIKTEDEIKKINTLLIDYSDK